MCEIKVHPSIIEQLKVDLRKLEINIPQYDPSEDLTKPSNHVRVDANGNMISEAYEELLLPKVEPPTMLKPGVYEVTIHEDGTQTRRKL